MTSVHKLQYLKVADKELPPTITFSDNRTTWTNIGMRSIFKVWKHAGRALSIDLKLGHLRKRANLRWEGKVQEDIGIARRSKDWRTVWELCRLLGGTQRGARKRNYKDVRRTDPSKE